MRNMYQWKYGPHRVEPNLLFPKPLIRLNVERVDRSEKGLNLDQVVRYLFLYTSVFADFIQGLV